MDVTAFGGQVACEQAWASRTLAQEPPSAAACPAAQPGCPPVIYEDRSCSGGDASTSGAGPSATRPASTWGVGLGHSAVSPGSVSVGTSGTGPSATSPGGVGVGAGLSAISPFSPGGVGAGSSAARPPALSSGCLGGGSMQPSLPRMVHVVQGIRCGKFVFKGSEEVTSIVNVQLVGVGEGSGWG